MYAIYINNDQPKQLSSAEQEEVISYNDNSPLSNDNRYGRSPNITEEHVDELFNVIKTAVKFALRLKNNRY